ncbi:BTAD domain-containing putative transcriptional regulator [Winogradskya humida]|uniref:SARP family transcriptional regulator n=1 Tax=Winogradskya humida TaxID=113566 RepID=A0ABQ3ZEE4_9ACTN|nr:BTAD domain-containing putative transcriptional regulator [Actinoplanes humidus]GIE16914.1 SARP family transcriptional regulator [Actinoplanes humidus]
MERDAGFHVTLLDAFEATYGDVPLSVAGARLQGLLVRLALAGGRAVEPTVLIDAIWGADLPANPGRALQALVTRLRQAARSAVAVVQAPGGYRLRVQAADVDALRFEQLAAAGRDSLRAGDPGTAAAVLHEAVALWGAALGAEPGVVAAVAPAAATRLATLSAEAVVDLADAELALGDAGSAAAHLSALLSEHPVHERAAALLMDALTATGRQADALGSYEQIREALADTLGADPGDALRERHLRLLRPGHHMAAQKSGGDDHVTPGNLPSPVTSFIGRGDDLARIGTLLAAGRLVTVLGPGGAGKTRLAIEAARRHPHEFGDGTWLIDLAVIVEPAKIGAAVLATIGMRDGATFRAVGDDLDVLVERFADRESLLLIDNCEHLIDAVAHLVAALLSRCPGLRVLATSREPLAIDGEALVPLGPLTLPEPDADLEHVRRAASVRLFTERAAAVRPGFAVDESTLGDVVHIVAELDGMPLALELAAARLRTLSLPELADGLSDRFQVLTGGNRVALPRHRTLRAVIAWSWELLSDRERAVAERIAVLPGGVTPASAAAVCSGTAVSAGEIPELLAALVDRSLLQLAPTPGRYRMLETLRQWGTDRLEEKGELGTVRGLAARYFAELIAVHDPQLRGPGQRQAMQLINAEYSNTLAGLRHLCDTGDATRAVGLALHLTWYWQMFGQHPDAGYWLGQALAVPGEPTPERDCVLAIQSLNGPGTAAGTISGETADELAGRLLAHTRLPSPWGLVTALVQPEPVTLTIIESVAGGDDGWQAGLAHMFRAQIAENAGDLDRMRTGVEAALVGFRQAGDDWGQAAVLSMRAQLRQYGGDLDGALDDLRQARSLTAGFGGLGLSDQMSDLHRIDLHLRRGETGPAVALMQVVRRRSGRTSAPLSSTMIDVREAGFRVRLGELDQARELLDNAERHLHGDMTSPGGHMRTLAGIVRAELCLEQGALAGAQEALAKAYAEALEIRDLPLLSAVAVNAAAIGEASGRHYDAAVLLGTAARLRGAHDRTDRQVLGLTRRGQASLGEQTFAEAYAKGWESGEASLAVLKRGRVQ